MVRPGLLCSASFAVSVAVGSIAQAQEAAPAEPSQEAKPANASEPDAMGDIVVTAQRREENLQSTALSISAVSGAGLVSAGVTQPTDLTRLVPGLQIASAGPVAQPYIRGVGNASNTGAVTSGVAFNLDGVYISQPQTFGVSLYDLARVEVVKGPQGTLYGRNATGGAINLITKEPSSERGGNLTFETGNYGLIRLTGGVNVPLAEDLALRVAMNFIERDGYFDDDTGSDSQKSVRARIKWTPGNHKLLFSGEYNKLESVPGQVILDGRPLGDTYNPINIWAGTSSSPNAPFVLAQDKTQPQFFDGEVWNFSADMNFDLGNGLSFTLLPAYREYRQSSNTYSFFRFSTIGFKYKQRSVESRLNYDSDSLNAVLGFYYFNQDQNTPFQVDLPSIVPDLPVPFLPPSFIFGRDIYLDVAPNYLTDKSVAVFGQATYHVTPAFRVTGGLRYSRDKTISEGVQTFSNRPGFGDLGPAGLACSFAAPCVQPFAGTLKSNNVSWKAGVEYDLAEDSMLYASASTGFKAGGISPARPPRSIYQPEKLTAYEIGVKNRFFDKRVQLNVEAFLWKYKDKQETFQGVDGNGIPTNLPDGTGVVTNLTINAGQATAYGGAVDLTVHPTQKGTFRVAVEYNHSKYDEFSPTAPSTGVPLSACPYVPSSTPGLLVGDCSGYPLTRAPKWSGVVSYNHAFALGNGGEISAGASGNFASSQYLDVSFLKGAKAPSYFYGNLDLTYVTPSRALSLTAFVRNVSDKLVLLNATAAVNVANRGLFAGSALPPRTYGVRLDTRF